MTRRSRALELPPPPAPLVQRKAVVPLEIMQPFRQRLLVGRTHALAPRVVPLVPLGELGKLASEHGKEAVPRRGAEPERRPDHVAGTRLLRRAHEPSEPSPVVGDAGEDGRHQQTGVNAAVVSRASARIRASGTGERSSSRRASRASSGGERDVDGDLVPFGESAGAASMSRVTSGDLVMIPIESPR